MVVLFLPFGTQELNPGLQIWQQAPLAVEPPHWPDYFFLCDWAAMHLAAVLADDRLIWMTNIFQIL